MVTCGSSKTQTNKRRTKLSAPNYSLQRKKTFDFQCLSNDKDHLFLVRDESNIHKNSSYIAANSISGSIWVPTESLLPEDFLSDCSGYDKHCKCHVTSTHEAGGYQRLLSTV